MYRKSILQPLLATCLLVLASASCGKSKSEDSKTTSKGAESTKGGETAKGAPSAKGADALVAYLPEGSVGMAVMDVPRLIGSPLFAQEPFKGQLARANSEGDFKILVEAGIDPFSTLETVVLAGDPEKFRIVTILSGRFDANKAATALASSIKNKKSLKPEHVRVAEAVGDNVLLIGTQDAVTSAKLGKGLTGSPDLAASYGAVGKTSAFYAVVAVPKSMTENAPVPQLQAVASVSLAVAIAEGIDLKASARFDSTENAEAAKGMIDGFLPMLEQQVPKELLSNLSFAVEGEDLLVTIGLSKDQFGGENGPLIDEGLSGLREVLRNILGWLTAP